jgi:hypothetical protein
MNDSIMKMNENKEQYVYVMSNPSFPADMLKIGWTREHPNIRANDLHTSGIPTPFIVEFVIITPEGSKLEKQIHNHIKSHRVNSNREFFKISKDELSEKLINDLMLELTPITDINTPINTKKTYHKKVNEIKSLYEELKKETDEFFSKLKKDKSELVITENNNKKYVSTRTIETEYNTTSLTPHGFEDNDERHIKNAYYFINRDIIQYKEWLDDLIDNYEEIKNRIGIEKLRSDNKSFKEMILDTHKDFRNLKNEYEWVF